MEELRKISNIILGCLKFTADCPFEHREGTIPVIDFQMYIHEGFVKYFFYESQHFD